MNIERRSIASLSRGLLPEYPLDPMPEIRAANQASGKTLVVLDDDPTGTQTVYDVSVLTVWDVESLVEAFGTGAACFYILTNSRSLPSAEARALSCEIGKNLLAASKRVGCTFSVASRSDSTLRGHFPVEVQALQAALQIEFDAWFLIPFFQEGGRFTVGDIHYVAEGEDCVPAGHTPYANDAAFGYRNSNLREWVYEKTESYFQAVDVTSIDLETVRRGPQHVYRNLMELPRGTICVVNALSYRDLESFTAGVLRAEASGKRYLYRTAASFVRVRAGLEAQPLLTAQDLMLTPTVGGLFLVGSYVPKSTAQLRQLLDHTNAAGVEIVASRLLDDAEFEAEVSRVATEINQRLHARQDVAVYTSRQLITGRSSAHSLSLGNRVSQGLIEVVQRLSIQPQYIVAKGGITSSDIATRGLGVKRARVAGQIVPGVPVWILGPESRYPGAAYIVFPGNVGDDFSLVSLFNVFRPS